MINRKYNEIVNLLSFTKSLKKLRSKINMSIDIPEIIEEFPDSHPRGFIKEFKKRRTTIVETYLRITKSLDSENHKERTNALHLLSEHILYSRSLKMPLNAARVQLAIMKKVISKRYNKREQLELMRDFSESSFGHPRSIRKFLKKFDIIEVPETGEELRNLDMGWDYHVHDNASYGRKSPTQLIIDAFIKGISEITVAYNNLEDEEAVKELLEAGRILGIKANIAIEFSAMTNGKRFHYMYILPEFSSRKKKFKRFLKKRNDQLDAFLHELEENQNKRYQNIAYLVDRFNNEHLTQINKGYNKKSIYYLNPLSLNRLVKINGNRIRSRRLLGDYLYNKLKPVLGKRLLQIKALKNLAESSTEQFSSKDTAEIVAKFNKINSEYSNLDPELLRLKYFADNDLIQAETAVSSLNEISKLARKAGGSIKFIQPLEHGLENAINMVVDNYEHISETEIFNLFDSIESGEKDFSHFSNFISYFNNRNLSSIKLLLETLNITIDQAKLENISASNKNRNIAPSIGSDATGSSTLAPGMGFILEDRLASHQKKHFKRKHFILPSEISDLMSANRSKKTNIICLGKVKAQKIRDLGNNKKEKVISLVNTIEYINPGLKNLFFVAVGFLPAYFTVGIEYALLWFTITGTRNIFVDMISANGFKPTAWSLKDINWTNLANSLFWTGFSVPILGFVKSRFDIFWQWDHSGSTYEFAKFFFINIANGIYLASHNFIRGFDKGTIRGNFFRSILAWPLSALFAPLGNALMLPSIVQAKFWSDFVAAIIEGSGKYKNIIRQKEKVIHSLLPNLEEEDKETEILAIMDLIYMMSESTRVKTVIKKQLILPPTFRQKMKTALRLKRSIPATSDHYLNFAKWMGSRKRFDLICNYVIQNYNNEQSSFLLNILSSKYTRASDWLKKISPDTWSR